MCVIGLFAFCTDVGKASNVSTTEKTLILVNDHPANLSIAFEALKSFDGLVIVVSNCQDLTFEDVKIMHNPPLFTAPAPASINLPNKVNYAPFKENKRFKPKFHAAHLFNPVKRC